MAFICKIAHLLRSAPTVQFPGVVTTIAIAVGSWYNEKGKIKLLFISTSDIRVGLQQMCFFFKTEKKIAALYLKSNDCKVWKWVWMISLSFSLSPGAHEAEDETHWHFWLLPRAI